MWRLKIHPGFALAISLSAAEPPATAPLTPHALLERLCDDFGGRLTGSAANAAAMENINWAASDHTPFQLAGVRAITFNAPIPRESVRYYHDLADTIDKVSPQLVDDSAAVIVDMVRTLAQDESLAALRRTPADTEQLFTRFGLDKRMRAMGLWPFEK